MKKKSWMVVLVSSLAMGWLMHGEADQIKINSSRIMINDKMPLPVVVIDKNGKISELSGEYDPSTKMISIETTTWAGPNASISIPVVGIAYLWMNGNWVDEEGFYWDGQRRAKISDPQWKERWFSYWRKHHKDLQTKMQNRVDNMREKGESRQEFGEHMREYGEHMRDQGEHMREKADQWQERMHDRREQRREDMHQHQNMHPNEYDSSRGTMNQPPAGFQQYQQSGNQPRSY